MGKSTLMFDHVDQLATNHAGLCVFDPMVCAPSWDASAAKHAFRLSYIEWDFDKDTPSPAIPYGPPRPDQPDDWRSSLFALDEVDLLCSPGKIHPTLRKLVHYSRHWGSTVLANFRRFQNVHKDLEGLATHIYVFATTAPRDLDRLDRLLEGTVNTEGKPYSRERIRFLRAFAFEEYQL